MKKKGQFLVSKLRNKRNQLIYDKIKKAKEGFDEYVTVTARGTNEKFRCLLSKGNVSDIEEFTVAGFLMKGTQEVLFYESSCMIKGEKIIPNFGNAIGASTFFRKALCGVRKAWVVK